MSDLEQLDRELNEYLEKEPNLNRTDRIVYLRAIFKKHMEFSKLDHVVNYYDIYEVISQAKSGYSKKRLPLKISDHEVETGELAQIVMAEAFICYLNRMNLLKKQVKFDYK